ncbi:lytic transglycosylase [Agaricicola taiwanensis]|uniref:Lytic transglycosylase n=1 Tax=Agaricicola taiwanensis TaxID=591372 RepID=A0A8J2YLD5_9RHOB|nr:lytic murein transglycosylase [Agaricicola taiwanensis]GGE50560.1 lytic transglycosylase [Agaricicola taiwanensis]
MRGAFLIGVLALAAASFAVPAAAQQQSCRAGVSFGSWLDGFKRSAAAQGISQSTIEAALGNVSFDPSVVQKDRGQGVFSQSFLQFSDRMVAQYRLQQGAAQIKKHRATFQRIEQQFGVPAEVIVAFWGLETDFGANTGDMPTIRSLATLAYDCRRPEMFERELLAALQLIERGDLSAQEMRGPWAGELGQLQFLPVHYMAHAVDFDGDGRRNLIKSAPDALASAGKYIQELGWQRGQPWLQEVKVPANLPWEQASIAIKLPRAQWAQWGVTAANGNRLPSDNLPASLLLPMGRSGPAFLAYPNFGIYTQWNNSLVYATTAAYFATRLAGAPKVGRGSGAEALSLGQIKELQQLLVRRGHHVGKVDGILGENTREAVKNEQLRLGLPADSYPTSELISRLR